MNDQPVPLKPQHEPTPATEPGRILPLSPDAIAQIHSSKHITTLQGVIASLLENSLDAGATKIDVSVDWKRGSCSVDDNGSGIPAAEFREAGGLAKMYCTSKRSAAGIENGSKHGSTGTFLAELAAMSLLTITSVHHRQTTISGMLTLHHGRAISRQTTNTETADSANVYHKHGTSVSVRDLFGNMPVRVKQRALAHDSGNEDDKAWSELRYNAVALLLAWPCPCAIRIRDLAIQNRKFNVTSGSTSALTERSLGQLTGRSVRHDLRDALPAIFQASLAPPESRSKWVPLSASTSLVSLKGMICLEPAPTRQCQFIAIGISPYGRGDNHHELYHVVHKLFTNSSFGGLEDDVSRTASDRLGEHSVKAQKGLDRHAMYYLQLSFRESARGGDIDHATMEDATMKSLIEVLEAAIHAWLESNHFRPRKRRRRRNNEQDRPTASRNASRLASPTHEVMSNISRTPTGGVDADDDASAETSETEGLSKRRRVIDLSKDFTLSRPAPADFLLEDGDWHHRSRVRLGLLRALPQRAASSRLASSNEPGSSTSGHDLGAAVNNINDHATIAVNTFRVAPLSAGELNDNRTTPRHTSATRSPSSDDFGLMEDADLLTAETAPQDHTTIWTDPISKQTFQVNSRTGVVLPVADNVASISATCTSAGELRQRAAIDTAVSSTGQPISLSRREALARTIPSTSKHEKQKWLPGFLREWKNPIFAKRDEEAIPTASISGPGLIEQLEEERRCCVDDKYHGAFSKQGEQTSGGTSLSRAALRHAEVIGQVDQKFILVRMPSSQDENNLEHHLGFGSTLVLIDQHAASERVILEDLLADMIAPTPITTTPGSIIKSASLIQSTTRAKPLTFELSSREHDLFTRHEGHFRHWGITYTVPPHTFASSLDSHERPGTQSHRLVVTRLPTAIAERCSNFPTLAIELLREEIWALEDRTRKPTRPSLPPPPQSEGAADSPSAWLSLLPAMPAKMLNMLHSRSCRSAIMFNDVLSKPECQHLVHKLAKCTFPFVCAHGRVGMVPVMDLGRSGEAFGGGLGLTAAKSEQTRSNGEDREGYGCEWDGNEGRIGLGRLGQFIGNVKQVAEDEGDDEEEEEMSEASPHKFA
ncbi:hypothetical protein Slin15195_G118150 [Septoria linicola]|uniref:MutL C-terminal dimerisation domain-containing protein n=1 Tax=Septoria linicola TaxID=215465 RepID=A0A9Q9B8V5_9PEZI|nr:hypothetical protein Slin14017_G095150 [Septoria linicola]USW58496.1 hypothetical protein Slin15195_G118150 [Septoria linicola]